MPKDDTPENVIRFPAEPPPAPNTLPQRDIDLLQNLGIHVDYIEALAEGKPFGADIINLSRKSNKEVGCCQTT